MIQRRADRRSNQTTTLQEVMVRTDDAALPGTLALPTMTHALVLFAHGSGSSRFSPRNRYVAGLLNHAGIGTLLFDLLTEREHAIDQRTRHLRFDIGLLSNRLVGAIDWAGDNAETAPLHLGLFGASTGAAAALVAAGDRPEHVRAVVSRGGRPDLAGHALPRVHAPTLLIVGEHDKQVIQLNREAARRMPIEPRIEIIPGATHLFEEPGTLQRAAELARGWFAEHLALGR